MDGRDSRPWPTTTTTSWWPTTTTSTIAGSLGDIEKLLKSRIQPGVTAPIPESKQKEGLAEELASAKKKLQEADKRLEDLIRWLRARIARANVMQLVGNLVSTLSGAGVVSAVFLQSYTAAVVTAVITFLSSILTLIGKQWLDPTYKGGESMGDLFAKAVGIKTELVWLMYKLDAARGDVQVRELTERIHKVLDALTYLSTTTGCEEGP